MTSEKLIGLRARLRSQAVLALAGQLMETDGTPSRPADDSVHGKSMSLPGSVRTWEQPQTARATASSEPPSESSSLAGHAVEQAARRHAHLVPSGNWCLTVRTPSFRVSLCHVMESGRVTTFMDRKGRGGGAMFTFLSDRAALNLFTGGKSFVMPIPTSFRMGRVIRAFKTFSGRVQEIMAGDPTDAPALYQRTALLLRATAEGICVVADHDPEVASKVAHIQEGIIQVGVMTEPDLTAYIKRDGEGFSTRWGAPETPPKARLMFADVQTAHAVLSGKTRALEAVADGMVQIRGRFPMIQNIFPVMDRLSDLMAIQNQE